MPVIGHMDRSGLHANDESFILHLQLPILPKRDRRRRGARGELDSRTVTAEHPAASSTSATHGIRGVGAGIPTGRDALAAWYLPLSAPLPCYRERRPGCAILPKPLLRPG